MALPIVISLALREKANSIDGMTEVRFEAADAETTTKKIGSIRMQLTDADAADVALNTAYTFTIT